MDDKLRRTVIILLGMGLFAIIVSMIGAGVAAKKKGVKGAPPARAERAAAEPASPAPPSAGPLEGRGPAACRELLERCVGEAARTVDSIVDCYDLCEKKRSWSCQQKGCDARCEGALEIAETCP